MKKQVKKLSKKIFVLWLATSIIFTSCFSHKKINAHATSVVAGLGAYTLYEICLYIGGLAVTTLGLGYAYENRDEIAEFGKSVIDSMSDFPSQGWILGSKTLNGDYVYGTEALNEVQQTEWTVIQGGGQSPKNDNDGDGDEDLDDREFELNLNKCFLTSAGLTLFKNHFENLFENWKNEDENIENNPIYNQYGSSDVSSYFDSNNIDQFKNEDGYYVWEITYEVRAKDEQTSTGRQYFKIVASEIVPFYVDYNSLAGKIRLGFKCDNLGVVSTSYYDRTSYDVNFDAETKYFKLHSTNMPLSNNYQACINYNKGNVNLNNTGITNAPKYYVIADWIAEDEAWKGYLEDIATSLRSLQDLFAISQQASSNAFTTQPTSNEYGDMLDNLNTEYVPSTEPIVEPTYYPATNTTPQLSPSEFPNYVPSTNPDIGGGTDNPSGDGTEEVPEIDLDGLLSIFNILFYLIMIIVMLIYLFLSCLAFIVMIFRIPASASMLPEDMVLGYEHLKTIMIPGMNISIYGFAMALIYLFIIFAVIKLIRLEINDFKFPRSYK